MSDVLNVDLAIIGGGSGGLSVAAGAVQMGASVVLFEKHKMGGDCLNYGCVPSKALLAAGKHAQAMREGAPFGVSPVEPEVDFRAAMGHVKSVIGKIEPHDSVERFEGLGVTVIEDGAVFTGPTQLTGGGKTVNARRVIIATGSRPGVPPISGLEDVPYLTNETLFENLEKPETLVIIGGGPIGMEMAQAHRRLGANVIVLDGFKALSKDDPEITAIALEKLRGEGIDIREGVKIASVAKGGVGIIVTFEDGSSVEGSHLLVAAGRRPNVEGLDLEKAGVKYDKRGVTVDDTLRSVSNRKVYAIGDVAGGLQFTHVAGYHAGVVIRSALFRMTWTKASTHHIPWVTYTDPEIAHVGMTEEQASKKFGKSASVVRWNLDENDRALAERATAGMVKVVLNGSKIVGASIVGKQAGEMIQLWAYAIANKQKIGSVTGYVPPYPTLGEASKRAAGQYYVPKLFSDRTKKIVQMLAKLG